MHEEMPEQKSVAVGDGDHARTFENIEKLQNWIQNQANLWNTLISSQPELGTIASAWNQTRDKANQLKDDPDALPRVIDSVNSARQRGFDSDSVRGQLVHQLIASSDHAGGAAACIFLNRPLHGMSNPHTFRGVFEALQYLYPQKDDVISILSSAEETLQDIRSWHAGVVSSVSEAEKEYTSLRSHVESEFQKGVVNINRLRKADISSRRNVAKKLSHKYEQYLQKALVKEQEFDNRIKQIQETYEQELALQAPVTYWEVKGNKYRHASVGWGVATILAFMLALVVVILGADLILHTPIYGESIVASVPVGAKPELAEVATFGLFVALFLWIVRFCAKQLNSRLHLYTDARERSVMAETYLSLLSRGAIPSDELSLILAPLFRPSADGIVKEDTGPHSPFVELLKHVKGS